MMPFIFQFIWSSTLSAVESADKQLTEKLEWKAMMQLYMCKRRSVTIDCSQIFFRHIVRLSDVQNEFQINTFMLIDEFSSSCLYLSFRRVKQCEKFAGGVI